MNCMLGMHGIHRRRSGNNSAFNMEKYLFLHLYISRDWQIIESELSQNRRTRQRKFLESSKLIETLLMLLMSD